jgi:peptidoglycan hydrolase CwlO-like protein
MTRLRRDRLLLRLTGVAGLLVSIAVASSASAGPSPDQLQKRLDATRSRERGLQSSIQSQTARIRGFQGRVADLRFRLAAIETSLSIERAQLERIQQQLRDARASLAALQARLILDRQALASQLVAQYEGDQPDLVSVVLSARGFADLLENVDALKRIDRENVRTLRLVRTERREVAIKSARLARVEDRQRHITGAVTVQRNQVAELKYAIIARELAVVRARARTGDQLAGVRDRARSIEHQLAQFAAPGGTLALETAGEFGFFPAPGTNYSVGNEPEIAARLNRLGIALQLHLIGISGYRSPEHSVEVGGFANDPHTQGAASDTPGVEGVPEGTLERFGLTRPFGGAAEADHIQLA